MSPRRASPSPSAGRRGNSESSTPRRGTPVPAEPRIVTDHFTIDLSTGRVTAGGADVRLTPTEWHLLEVLARTAGRIVEHERLLTDV